MINEKTDEIIEKICKSILNRYQNNLETPVRGSDFIFYYVPLFYYTYHKINPNHSGLYKNSPICIKNKKATINFAN